MITRILTVLLICFWKGSLIGSPASDLSSPSQETRDAAAKTLRSSYTTPSRPNWDAIVGTITNGMAKSNIVKLLSPFKVASRRVGGSSWAVHESYRLDDAWVLYCDFVENDILLDRELRPILRDVWVKPSTNFTGIWIVYYVNGQKSQEIHYDNGKCHGEYIRFNPDGSKSQVVHYDHGILEGVATTYFAGRTNYSGVYKAGKPVGIWVWYKEDGTLNFTQDWPE